MSLIVIANRRLCSLTVQQSHVARVIAMPIPMIFREEDALPDTTLNALIGTKQSPALNVIANRRLSLLAVKQSYVLGGIASLSLRSSSQ